MSEWTACAFGELALPDGALAAWRLRVGDASRYSDWPYRDAVPQAALPVAKLLGEIEQLGRRGNHVELVESPARVSVRALFSGETTLWCQTIVLALREAAAVGAQGEVTFVDATEPAPTGPLEGEVLRLEVREGKSRFRRLRGAEAAVVRGDPQSIATVMEIIGASVMQPKSSRRGGRLEARDDAFVRGQAKRGAADEKRAALSAGQALGAFRKAVRAGIKTHASAVNAQGYLQKIVADPGPQGEQALRDAWRTLIARAPKLRRGITALDTELKLRLAVGKAILRLGTPRVADATVRAKLRAPARKEWPNEAELRDAVARLLKLDP